MPKNAPPLNPPRGGKTIPKPKRVRPAGVGASAFGGARISVPRPKPKPNKVMANAMSLVVAGNEMASKIKNKNSGDWQQAADYVVSSGHPLKW